jgi:diguanylate cyclase (GGDEF)-like protein
MPNGQLLLDTITRFIEEFHQQKSANGQPRPMNGSDLLRIIKITDFENIVKCVKKNIDIYSRVSQIESRILNVLSLRDFFKLLIPDISNILNISYVWISVIEKSSLADLISRSIDSKTISKKVSFINSRDFNKLIMNNTKPMIANKYLSPFSIFFPEGQSFPVRSMAFVPIHIDGKCVGTLNFGDFASTRFDPNADKSLVEPLMTKISLCLSNILAHEQVTHISTYDVLTELLNRATFEKILTDELNKSSDLKKIFSLVLMDVDGFKNINSRCGYGCGDAVLKHIAQFLKTNISQTDVAARFSGDQFALMIYGKRTDAIEGLMIRIQQGLDANPIHYNRITLKTSLSYGIASVEKETNIQPEALVKNADAWKLAAKKQRTSREISVVMRPELRRVNAS